MSDWPEGAVAYLKCPDCGQPGVWLRSIPGPEYPIAEASEVFRDDGQTVYDCSIPECQRCGHPLHLGYKFIISKGAGDE